MKNQKVSMLVVIAVALISFSAGALLPRKVINAANADQQKPEPIRDAQGKFLPQMTLPLPSSKAFLGAQGMMAYRVYVVEKGSPAELVGLQKNDLITRIDSKEFFSIYDFFQLLGEKAPGETADIEFVRYDSATGKTKQGMGKAILAPRKE